MKINRFFGIFLIVFGGLYLFLQVMSQLNYFSFEVWYLWPLFTIGLGLLFEVGYFKRRKTPGLLIPGGLITTIGCLHLFESLTNWQFSNYTWPLYILAVMVGFFQHWMVTKSRGTYVVTIIFFIIFLFNAVLVATSLLRGYASANVAFSVMIILVGFLLVKNAKYHD